jgi:hypothetical protein
VKPGTTGHGPPVVVDAPFNDNFLNNVPAEAVPADDTECVSLGAASDLCNSSGAEANLS